MPRSTVLVPLYDTADALTPSVHDEPVDSLNPKLVRVYCVSADLQGDSPPLLERLDQGVREWLRSRGGRYICNLPPGDDSPGLSVVEIERLRGRPRASLDHVLNVVSGVTNLEISYIGAVDTAARTADEKLGVYNPS